MIFAKIIGGLLVFLGTALIIYTLYFSYNIFTGVVSAPEIFKPSDIVFPQEKGVDINKEVSINNISRLINDQLSEQLFGRIISPEIVTKFLNLVVWSMLAGILIFGGSQIAGLGVKLIKE